MSFAGSQVAQLVVVVVAAAVVAADTAVVVGPAVAAVSCPPPQAAATGAADRTRIKNPPITHHRFIARDVALAFNVDDSA